jgi:F0F1-type ATP synthase assembly protein I
MSLLLDDLRKRRVVRVAIVYLLVAVAAVLTVALVEVALGLPDWTLRAVAGAAFVVMPFVLVMTWALDNHGPENLKTARRR